MNASLSPYKRQGKASMSLTIDDLRNVIDKSNDLNEMRFLESVIVRMQKHGCSTITHFPNNSKYFSIYYDNLPKIVIHKGIKVYGRFPKKFADNLDFEGTTCFREYKATTIIKPLSFHTGFFHNNRVTLPHYTFQFKTHYEASVLRDDVSECGANPHDPVR